MTFRHFALVPALILVASACSGSGSSPSASVAASSPSVAAPSPSVAALSPPSVSSTTAAPRIEVKLTDALRMVPGTMTVKAGQPVTFVVTNTGAIQHEFYLGDDAAQEAHEKEMASMDRMGMDEPDGIVLKPGETMELTHTFPKAGAFLAGCHETAHYAGGMKASITVTE